MTGTRYIICENCGAKIRDQGFNESSPIYADMQRDEICWECAYWKRILSDKGMRIVVIDGLCYDFKPWVGKIPPNATLGGNGKLLHIATFKGKICKSNDAWLIGKVPERFRTSLPDNAVEITRRAYRTLSKRRIMCNDIGCLDRYTCVFYDKTIEENNEPFNKVPENWVEGSEFCKSFLSEGELKRFTPQIDSKQFHNLIKLIRV